jgi:hypothetical protein
MPESVNLLMVLHGEDAFSLDSHRRTGPGPLLQRGGRLVIR